MADHYSLVGVVVEMWSRDVVAERKEHLILLEREMGAVKEGFREKLVLL